MINITFNSIQLLAFILLTISITLNSSRRISEQQRTGIATLALVLGFVLSLISRS